MQKTFSGFSLKKKKIKTLLSVKQKDKKVKNKNVSQIMKKKCCSFIEDIPLEISQIKKEKAKKNVGKQSAAVEKNLFFVKKNKKKAKQ
jgi:hypothetical protein